MDLRERISRAWDVFKTGGTNGYDSTKDLGFSYGYKPDRLKLNYGADRSIVTSIYNRISTDVAAAAFRHVRVDQNGRYVDTIKSGLNECLTDRANVDQTGRAFIQDVVLSMFDEGCVGIVPTSASADPRYSASYDIYSLRTCKILEWYPRHVRVQVYNDKKGEKTDKVLPKSMVAIVENPFYTIMNEPSSTLKRLTRKLATLDNVDDQIASNKLNMIIQLPYVIKTRSKREEADKRLKDIEMQLSTSKLGIAYTDGTEKIMQLNKPLENNLMAQVEYLTSTLYSQLGLTKAVFEGTANEQEELHYYNTTIEPVLSAIADALRTTFLSKTARTQGQSVMYFTQPFRLVPVQNLADIADKFTRNEIMSANEFRAILGFKPDQNPASDQLHNSNMPLEDQAGGNMDPNMMSQEQIEGELADLEGYDQELDDMQRQFQQSDDDDDILLHYASPYYDPQKAHDYYMRTRELKGRKSTSGLNDKGKETAKYVREQLAAEKKSKTDASRNTANARVKATSEASSRNITAARERQQAQNESHSAAMKSKIETLRASLEGLSTEEKKARREEINAEIDRMREENNSRKEQLYAAYRKYADTTRAASNKAKTGFREEHKKNSAQYKQEYNDKYEAELEKIRSDTAMQKQKKTKKSSGKKSSSSKKSGGIPRKEYSQYLKEKGIK